MNLTQRISLAIGASLTALLVSACNTAPTTPSASAFAIAADQSSLNFVTTKAGQAGAVGVAETQMFKRFSGGMDAQGKISLVIDLASVDTGVEIRDERLRNLLWNVKATPTAVFSANLDATAMAAMNKSGATDVDLAGQLQLAGQTKPVTAKLRVNRLSADKILVTTRAPVIINSNDFGLKAGVEAMREVMGLNVLSPSAPVNFALQLNRI